MLTRLGRLCGKISLHEVFPLTLYPSQEGNVGMILERKFPSWEQGCDVLLRIRAENRHGFPPARE